MREYVTLLSSLGLALAVRKHLPCPRTLWWLAACWSSLILWLAGSEQLLCALRLCWALALGALQTLTSLVPALLSSAVLCFFPIYKHILICRGLAPSLVKEEWNFLTGFWWAKLHGATRIGVAGTYWHSFKWQVKGCWSSISSWQALRNSA